MNKNTISVVLPVHKLDENTKKLLFNAIKSIEGQLILPDELVIVVPAKSDELKYVSDLKINGVEVKIIENHGDTDVQTQINLGVENAKSEWVSILEFDDEYANIWFKNAKKYMESYSEVSAFLPIVIDVDTNNNFIGFTNEAVWANGFSDEMGYLDLNSLLNYQNFSIDGMVIKKSMFTEYGGFKQSIKLTFLYEFFLRLAFKDVKMMVVPRFGYKHMVTRPDSLFETYKQTIDPVEARWWLAQAKKEYYFEKDRKITYEVEPK